MSSSWHSASSRLRCHLVEQGRQTGSPDTVCDTITLDETDRHRRRIALQSDNGIDFLLELNQARLLRNGDILRLDDGRGIRVVAKPESLYLVRGRNPSHLLKLTWHVGNRHLATQIMDDHIRIRRDAVIRSMLEELGAEVEEISAGFDPVGGAYESHSSEAHTHVHTHADPHEHLHEHPHEHLHEHPHEHLHERSNDDSREHSLAHTKAQSHV